MRRKLQEWMGRPPAIQDEDLNARLRAAAVVHQDVVVLAASAERLAAAFRNCGVMHLQLASAAQDVGRHLPTLVDAINGHKAVAQSHSKQCSALAAMLDAFQARVAAIASSCDAAVQSLRRLQQQFAQQRREVEVECAAYERSLKSAGPAGRGAAGGSVRSITQEAVQTAMAADQGRFPSAQAARLAEMEARVVAGFNALDRLRADMRRRTELLGPEQVDTTVWV